MICKKCGNSIGNNAKFCNKCGSAISSYSESFHVAPKGDTSSLNRDALVIYLRNLCIMETIIHQSKKTIDKLSKQIEKAENKFNNLEEEKRELENYPRDFDELGIVLLVLVAMGYAIFYGLSVVAFGFIPCVIIAFMDGSLELFFTLIVLCAISGALGGFIYVFKKNQEDKKNHIENIKQVDDKLAIISKQYDVEKVEYPRKRGILENEINKLNQQIRIVSSLLQKAYDINIVPCTNSKKSGNLRTIGGVYYLYEFMCSTREPFSAALTHYKFDVIISKLDELIRKMEDVIYNQNILMEQNNKMLFEIRRNAELTHESMKNLEDYAEISAQNTAIQTELAKDALFYQKVKFITDL